MVRTYHHKGFTLEVAIESNLSWPQQIAQTSTPAYVAIVTIARTGTPVAIFSPLRFGDVGGKAFATQEEALLAGYSVARHLVDDLL